MEQLEGQPEREEDETSAHEVGGRILGHRGLKREFVTSQRDYVPSPFKNSAWEFVGARIENMDFIPLEVAIVPTDTAAADPMFEDFGNLIQPDQENFFHTRTGTHNQGFVEPSAVIGGIDPAEVEARIQEALEAGHAQGYQEGKEETTALIAERYEELQARFTSFESEVQQTLAEFVARTEENALKFAMQVAGKILQTTAEAKPEYIFEVLRKGLASLGAAKPTKIRVSNQDYEFLNIIGTPPDIDGSELGYTFIPDENITSGCVIETDYGETDLQLTTMWEQVKDSLFGKK